MAYGSDTGYGPACGRCFKLTLLNTFLSDPPFHPRFKKSIVVKVTDMCPYMKDGWCGGTGSNPNPAGNYLNFDLASPSSPIPADFFPSDVSLYGYSDFGVWNGSYESVSCTQWAGFNDPAALGAVGSLADGFCCPADPTGSSGGTCPSFPE